MAKINTTNYQPVTAWNGTQDLFIVEQPDGTKVATPEQIRQYMNAFMDDEPTEGSEEAVKSGGVFNAIENSVSLKSATGNPITLTDAANTNAEELSMTIEPIQSGSGDPSPTNVRPISGISTASVQTTDGTDTNTASITLGQTVYGGSVNFKTGEVTVTHGMVDLGTLTYSYNAGNTRFITTVSDMKSVNDWIAIDVYCSQYKKRPMAPGWAENNTFGTFSSALYIRDTRYTEPATFKTAMSGVQLCYELANPTTLTLTPAELELLKGNNTITANGAEISLKYYPDNAIGALAERVDDVQEQIATKANTTDVNAALATKANQTTVTIPRFIPSQAGWRRICKIKPISGMSTVDAMVYIGGAWTNGQPPSASLAVSIMGSSTSLTLLSSAIGDSNKMTDIRLVSASSGAYWVDVYFPAYSSNTGIFKLTFTGDIAVSDIQNPISITTDSTAASAEISLNQNVSGTVLTDKSVVETISGTGAYGSTYTAYKYGRIVQLSVRNVTNETTEQAMILFSLPEGWRPIIQTDGVGTYFNASYDAATLGVVFRIDTNGDVKTYSYRAFNNGRVDITYITN